MTNPDLKEKINEYLDTLQNSNRSFLIGAGCSKCAKLPLTKELYGELKKKLKKGSKPLLLLESIVNNFEKNDNVTIEEYISELVDYVSILQRRVDKGTKNDVIEINGVKYNQEEFKEVIDDIQLNIVNIIEEKTFTLEHHYKFINAIHNHLDNGKNINFSKTNYFVLNYDTLIEDALSMNKINYADGFRGGAIGWWDIDSFNDEKIVAKLFKLHGSLDWCISKDDIMPRRLKLKSKHPSYKLNESVLIYPCATKYKETQNDPFAQLLNYYRDELRNKSKSVLTIIGYRFADNHINLEIEKALLEGKNLTVIIFTELNTPNDHPILNKWFKTEELKPHIKFFAKKGFYHHNIKFEETGGGDLDWWRFEILTKILSEGI